MRERRGEERERKIKKKVCIGIGRGMGKGVCMIFVWERGGTGQHGITREGKGEREQEEGGKEEKRREKRCVLGLERRGK